MSTIALFGAAGKIGTRILMKKIVTCSLIATVSMFMVVAGIGQEKSA